MDTLTRRPKSHLRDAVTTLYCLPRHTLQYMHYTKFSGSMHAAIHRLNSFPLSARKQKERVLNSVSATRGGGREASVGMGRGRLTVRFRVSRAAHIV